MRRIYPYRFCPTPAWAPERDNGAEMSQPNLRAAAWSTPAPANPQSREREINARYYVPLRFGGCCAAKDDGYTDPRLCSGPALPHLGYAAHTTVEQGWYCLYSTCNELKLVEVEQLVQNHTVETEFRPSSLTYPP